MVQSQVDEQMRAYVQKWAKYDPGLVALALKQADQWLKAMVR
jgi:hypothetical protein